MQNSKVNQSTEQQQSRSSIRSLGNMFRNSWQINPQCENSVTNSSDEEADGDGSKQVIIRSPGKQPQIKKNLDKNNFFLPPIQQQKNVQKIQADSEANSSIQSNFMASEMHHLQQRQTGRPSPNHSERNRSISPRGKSQKHEPDIFKSDEYYKQKSLKDQNNFVIEEVPSSSYTESRSRISKNEYQSQPSNTSNPVIDSKRKMSQKKLFMQEVQRTLGVKSDTPKDSLSATLAFQNEEYDRRNSSFKSAASKKKDRPVVESLKQPQKNIPLRRFSGQMPRKSIEIQEKQVDQQQHHKSMKRKAKSSKKFKNVIPDCKNTAIKRQCSKSFLQDTQKQDYNKIKKAQRRLSRMSNKSSLNIVSEELSARQQPHQRKSEDSFNKSMMSDSSSDSNSVSYDTKSKHSLSSKNILEGKQMGMLEKKITGFIRQMTQFSRSKTMNSRKSKVTNKSALRKMDKDLSPNIIDSEQENKENIDLGGQTGGTVIKMLSRANSLKLRGETNQEQENEDIQPLNDDDATEHESSKKKRKKSKSGSVSSSRTYRSPKGKKWYLIYPENQWKERWDFLITLLLIGSCIFIPYNISFPPTTDQGESNADLAMYIMDILFLLDIILTFLTVIFDEEYQQCDNMKVIAKSYFHGWFFIDLAAIFPFEFILKASTDYNALIRITRIGRLYRLVKLTKLLRMVKFLKQKNRFMEILTNTLNFGAGIDRLIFFIFMFFILCHTVCCFFVLLAQLYDETLESTWMAGMDTEDNTQGDLYAIAFYWCITTITTVGYGDISATNTPERWFCSALMVVGVIAFSFANGSLNLILSEVDSKNAVLQEKVAILDKIRKKFKIPNDLYIKCKKNLEYTQRNEFDEMHAFLAELPHGLMVDISLFIYEERYKFIRFFQDKQSSFISWICPLLRQQIYDENVYIYNEEEDITNVYFLLKGKACFVLPSFQNVDYIVINIGDEFGIIDIFGSCIVKNIDFENWITRKDLLTRQFTVMATSQSEVLCLNINDLGRMRKEFFDSYDELFKECNSRLKRAWQLKMRAIKSCRKQLRLKNLGMDEETIDVLPKRANSNNVQADEDPEMRDIINFKYEGAMNLHQIDEQSLEEVESTSSISESVTTSELDASLTDSDEQKNASSEESKNDSQNCESIDNTDNKSKTSISITDSEDCAERGDSKQILINKLDKQKTVKMQKTVKRASQNDGNTSQSIDNEASESPVKDQNSNTKQGSFTQERKRAQSSMMLMNFFTGFQGPKKESTPQGYDQALAEDKNAKPSPDKKDATPVNPSPAVTAQKFLKPKPAMKHKESMKLGKDILNTLATAAKRAGGASDDQPGQSVQAQRIRAFGSVIGQLPTVPETPQIPGALPAIQNTIPNPANPFGSIGSRFRSGEVNQQWQASANQNLLSPTQNQINSSSGAGNEEATPNTRRTKSSSACPPCNDANELGSQIEEQQSLTFSRSDKKQSGNQMRVSIASIPETQDQEASTILVDSSQQQIASIPANDSVAKKLQQMQKTMAMVQQIEEEQQKLQERRAMLMAQLAQQQEDLMQSTSRQKLTIEDDSFKVEPGIAIQDLTISNPILEGDELDLINSSNRNTRQQSNNSEIDQNNGSNPSIRSKSSQTSTARTQKQANESKIEQQTNQNFNDYGF